MTKGRVSIVIPSRHEPYLAPTVRDCLKQATGDVEVIVVLDGWWPKELPEDKRLSYLHWGEAKGLRPSLNAAVEMATGEFLCKLDGHCALAKGYDEVLKKACGESDVVVPAKRSLNPDDWTMFKQPWHYYHFLWLWQPVDGGGEKFVGLQDRNYGSDYNAPREATRIDDIITYQGSAWMLRRKWWDTLLPLGMDSRYYYAAEPVEIGLSSWVNGGRVRIVKDVEYGHLWKGSGANKRQFSRDRQAWHDAMWWAAQHWLAHPKFPALLDKFGLQPGWPSDWQQQAQRRFAS